MIYRIDNPQFEGVIEIKNNKVINATQRLKWTVGMTPGEVAEHLNFAQTGYTHYNDHVERVFMGQRAQPYMRYSVR